MLNSKNANNGSSLPATICGGAARCAARARVSNPERAIMRFGSPMRCGEFYAVGDRNGFEIICGVGSTRSGRTCESYHMSDEISPSDEFMAHCNCNTCSGHIEFDARLVQVGTVVDCPHCGLETTLYIPKTNPSSVFAAATVALKELVESKVSDPPPTPAPDPPPVDTSANQVAQDKASSHQVEEVLFKESSVEESVVAMALTVVAALELIAAPIAGLVVGSDNTFRGVAIFTGGFTGGLILLGFAKVIDHSYEQAQRMRRIERLLLKASADKKST
jgi:hypothetical protein